MGEREKILDYLDTGLTEPIRDPVWKHVYLSPAHERIISLPVFQELHDVKQLGPAYLVYPGATHTRFAHSLGTFHIARRLIDFLVRRSGRPVFTLDGVKAFLCAALLHDLGHYPFAHSLKNLGLADHEVLTGRLVRETPLSAVLENEAGVDSKRVASIVDTTLAVAGDGEVIALRRLLSGVLDPDKLDYLNRDAYYCGVPYGIQDVDFFLGEVVADADAGFMITPKGLTAVEHILFSKYLMYKTVYWHKTVRAATAMIKKALRLALRDAVLAPDDLYRLTDSTLIRLAERRSYAPLGLIREVFERRLYKRVFLSVPFREENDGHRALAGDAGGACAREAESPRGLSARGRRAEGPEEHEVVIDIPEAALVRGIDLCRWRGSSGAGIRAHDLEPGPRSRESFGEALRTVSLIIVTSEEMKTVSSGRPRSTSASGIPFTHERPRFENLKRLEIFTKKAGRGVNRFRMIGDGDRVLIGVSGGKDSLALCYALAERRKRLPIRYELEGLFIDWREYPVGEEQYRKIQEYCAGLGIPLRRTAARKMFPESFRGRFDCYLCSRNRKAHPLQRGGAARGEPHRPRPPHGRHRRNDAFEPLFPRHVRHHDARPAIFRGKAQNHPSALRGQGDRGRPRRGISRVPGIFRRLSAEERQPADRNEGDRRPDEPPQQAGAREHLRRALADQPGLPAVFLA